MNSQLSLYLHIVNMMLTFLKLPYSSIVTNSAREILGSRLIQFFCSETICTNKTFLIRIKKLLVSVMSIIGIPKSERCLGFQKREFQKAKFDLLRPSYRSLVDLLRARSSPKISAFNQSRKKLRLRLSRLALKEYFLTVCT